MVTKTPLTKGERYQFFPHITNCPEGLTLLTLACVISNKFSCLSSTVAATATPKILLRPCPEDEKVYGWALEKTWEYAELRGRRRSPWGRNAFIRNINASWQTATYLHVICSLSVSSSLALKRDAHDLMTYRLMHDVIRQELTSVISSYTHPEPYDL